MRIVAGVWKGRRLLTPPHANTRPTSGRVREAVFQILGPFFAGGVVLDLFAGSGAVAFEALSRGMERAVLVETSPQALRVIRENARLLGAEGRIRVIPRPVEKAADLLVAGGPYDLVYADPPYAYPVERLAALLAALAARGALAPDVKIAVERAARSGEVDFARLREALGGLSGEVRLRRFGDTTVWFLFVERPSDDPGVL
ncbi:MAG: 16S rRNA (guanine(966)-N(2))-methyltransferase [Brockia lithotrophica]|uniref:16S rRNA (Guanine(966)-N(2))-methyltransferase n=1 Tax=Brockia lithotrophica TaxID=933949 RepID=A0A2T5G6A5_9BACL|nr:16S rRNA (guanine(966)-N(2))-methyltransferase RsmD [Brockia lithotrophica]PTQ51713.1 MAG: 16S rRNA (guanine(966)-N(2))-methyltransferase [Brockia lithotrophica]